MMNGTFVVTVCLLLSTALAENDAGNAFRNDLKEIIRICDEGYCPAYTVKEKSDDYELRVYPNDFYAATRITSIDPKGAYDVLSLRLKAYTLGDNDDRENVQTGIPTFMDHHLKEDGTLIRNFSQSLLISKKFNKEIPAPLSPLVRIVMWKSKSYYTAVFCEGKLTMDEVLGHAKSLAQALKRDNRTFDENEFTVATYENKVELCCGHFEIFFTAK